MSEFLTEINYDKLIEKSLKNVVVEALKIAERQGLPGEHHFYITFKTNHQQTRISDQLKSQYPEEMTIVIQHQFSNLIVETSGFGIDLSFGGIRQTLYIPFDAITYFADPYAKFGLSFNFDDEPISHNTDNDFAAEMEEEPKKTSNGVATVVSIDAFRKKKMRKKSVVIAGRHQTSISLEDEFYAELAAIAKEKKASALISW